MRLSEFRGKSNNLQLLRFLAAILVIVSHSFALSTGSSKQEWMMVLTDGQISLGGVAVSVFFCAGGYLIAKSIQRVQNGLDYFKIRIMRIFPCLITVIVFSAFVLGPLVSSYSIEEYFSDSQVYRYLLNGVLMLQHNLPGVFQENPYLPTVNGVLWTLPLEFLCYIACFLMWKLRFLEKKRCVFSIPLVVLGALSVHYLGVWMGTASLTQALRPVLLFYMGVLYFVYRDSVILERKKLWLCILLLFCSVPLHLADLGMILFFPYILFYFCFATKQVSEDVGNAGNISYGIYLCAYPIQQVLVWMYGGVMSPYWNMVLAIPLAAAAGYLLYQYIEKPVNEFKTKKSCLEVQIGL